MLFYISYYHSDVLAADSYICMANPYIFAEICVACICHFILDYVFEILASFCSLPLKKNGKEQNNVKAFKCMKHVALSLKMQVITFTHWSVHLTLVWVPDSVVRQ